MFIKINFSEWVWIYISKTFYVMKYNIFFHSLKLQKKKKPKTKKEQKKKQPRKQTKKRYLYSFSFYKYKNWKKKYAIKVLQIIYIIKTRLYVIHHKNIAYITVKVK